MTHRTEIQRDVRRHRIQKGMIYQSELQKITARTCSIRPLNLNLWIPPLAMGNKCRDLTAKKGEIVGIDNKHLTDYKANFCIESSNILGQIE